MNQVEVLIINDPTQFSLNPLDSDSVINAILMEQIVGTLVRLSESGRYEGFLAKSWNVFEDGRIWHFELRADLRLETGDLIDAPYVVNALNRQIRLVSKYSKMPLIEDLEGFDYSETKVPISGIKAISENKIELKFRKKVRSGLLEYLGLPYLGIYSNANYDENGDWKNEVLNESSGFYRIESRISETEVNLELREEFARSLGRNDAPKKVVIKIVEPQNLVVSSKSQIIINFSSEIESKVQQLNKLKLMPTILHAIVLNPHSEVFKDINHRRNFRDQLKYLQKKDTSLGHSLKMVNTFYPNQSTESFLVNEYTKENFNGIKEIVLKQPKNPSNLTKMLSNLASRAIKDRGLSIIWRTYENAQQNMMGNFRSSEGWDVHFVKVDIGGGIENQLIKFMFCSKLGVSFPDPENKVCELVNRYEEKHGELIQPEIMKNYVRQFDELIFDQASVIPMLKTGYTWYFTRDLDSSRMTSVLGIPYLELLGKK